MHHQAENSSQLKPVHSIAWIESLVQRNNFYQIDLPFWSHNMHTHPPGNVPSIARGPHFVYTSDHPPLANILAGSLIVHVCSWSGEFATESPPEADVEDQAQISRSKRKDSIVGPVISLELVWIGGDRLGPNSIYWWLETSPRKGGLKSEFTEWEKVLIHSVASMNFSYKDSQRNWSSE